MCSAVCMPCLGIFILDWNIFVGLECFVGVFRFGFTKFYSLENRMVLVDEFDFYKKRTAKRLRERKRLDLLEKLELPRMFFVKIDVDSENG
jgi:hypothetical protein